MDRESTIINLAAAMGIEVHKEQYESQYDSSTGTYYCNVKNKNSLAGKVAQ